MKVEIEKDLQNLKRLVGNSDDVTFKTFNTSMGKSAVAYIDGFVDKQSLYFAVLKVLYDTPLSVPVYDKLCQLPIPESVNMFEDLNEALSKVLSGNIVLLIDGAEGYFCMSLKKTSMRAISEPPTESVIRGPREGFIEDYKTNITLLRRRIKNSNLIVNETVVGKQSNTSVAVCYIKGIADEKIVEEVKKRISKIKIDGVPDSYYIEQYLSEQKYSLFNQVGISEKPDVVSAKLLEGRVAVIVDGSPSVLTVPFLLFESVQDSYDYYSNDWRASLIRIFRIIGMVLTIFLPAVYVCLLYTSDAADD